MKRKYTGTLCAMLCCAALTAQTMGANLPPSESPAPEELVMTSSSRVDWNKFTFSSTLSIDVEKADIPLPSGRGTAVDRIDMALPQLIKDALFSLPVDSDATIGDVVLRGDLQLSRLTQLLNGSEKTAGYFSPDMTELSVRHRVSLADIGALMVRHTDPYQPKTPLEIVPSRAYSGIIIDARGALPVHGEYVSASTEPAIFPRVWDETMELIYEKNMVTPQTVKSRGLVQYSSSISEKEYESRIGKDPLRITARGVYGFNRTDPVISRSDALKILTVRENRDLLKNGRVVILIDQDQLVHDVTAPLKDDAYYFTYQEITDYFAEHNVSGVTVTDSYKGITISINDLHFKADSDELLSDDKERLDRIATALLAAVESGSYSVFAEGHTASVGKPVGEQQLSIDRAKRIVDELVSRGLSGDIFTYAGRGGTLPVASNDTEEGRAKNRRVELTITPLPRPNGSNR